MKYENLCIEIEQHNYNYYVFGKPTISDAEYDQLFEKLIEFEKKHPELKSPTSPTQKVGGEIAKSLPSDQHNTPMLSLRKLTNLGELRSFVLKPEFTKEELLVFPKADGFSVSVHYENGRFIKAVSRGDGQVGQVISHSIKTVRSLPLNIKHSGKLEIRGECIILKKDFDILNKTGEYTSPRNLAAGSAKLLDSSEVAKRRLDIVVFSGIIDGFSYESDILEHLKTLGFKVIDYKLFKDKTALEQYCINYQREELPYDIDGVVIKCNNISLNKLMGENSREPRYAAAYKFAAQSAGTILKEVRWQISRNGILTPVAIFEPIYLADAQISQATLHNADFAGNYRIGSKIEVARAGEIIPRVMGTLVQGTGDKVIPPATCPECSEPVMYKSPIVYCQGTSCTSKIIERIIHFSSKYGMDIQGLGDSIITNLVRTGKIKSPADLYSLKAEDLLDQEYFAIKKAENIISSINGSKNPPLNKFIFALGIPHTGVNTSKNLAEKYQSIDNLLKATFDDLSSIGDIGEITASSIQAYLTENKDYINQLITLGISPFFKKNVAENILQNKQFVITGTLSSPREEIKALIESYGGKVAGSVSSKTDYLLIGSNVGSVKINKATTLGVKVIMEKDLEAMLN